MALKYSMKLSRLIELAKEKIVLEPVQLSDDYENVYIDDSNLNRPGLQLAGFYDYFNSKRVQLIGKMETSFLSTLSPDERRERFDKMLSYSSPVLIVCHEMEPYPECIEMAIKHNISIFKCSTDTSEVLNFMMTILKKEIAPRITRHGVFVEVYGEGILILGESGIGKSEAAVELIKRGHRLIADDAVEIKKVDANTLVGSAPELIRYYIELRGIGIVDVRRIFGIGAVKLSENIDMVINIEQWNEGQNYDRMGADEKYIDILGVKLPYITIPVTPGRNLAVIFEVAAMNNRQKKMGYNSAVEFTNQLNRHFEADPGI